MASSLKRPHHGKDKDLPNGTEEKTTTVLSCVICAATFRLSERTFEQKLVDDTSICPPCWHEIIAEGD